MSGEIVGYRVFRDGIPVGQTATPGMTRRKPGAVDDLPGDGRGRRLARCDQRADARRWQSRRRPRRRRTGTCRRSCWPRPIRASTTWRPTTSRSAWSTRRTSNVAPAVRSQATTIPLVTGWAEARGVAVMPRLNCQNPNDENQILNEPAVEQTMIEQLAALCATYGYQGIQIDFEGAAPERAQPVHRVHHRARRQASLPGRQAVDDRHRQVLQHHVRAGRDV